jgi:SSS family solute:Na+ symporter
VIHLAWADIAVIALYFAAVLYVGFRSAKATARSDEDDFLLAGRSLTLPIFVMTLVSTWYGGILGVGEFSYRYGISNWVIQGVPYYVFAGLFAMVLAGKVRATNLHTIPDKLEASYGRPTAVLGGVLTFILMTPAPYILMLSLFLQLLFGWSLAVSILVTAVVTISYLFWGGFRSDIETDVLEFVVMFGGFAVILPFCYARFGGMAFLEASLPPLHLTWDGGNSAQFIIVWFFIALWTLVDPAFHQRCYAAKDGRTARNGILVSILFWFLFDAMTATAGLYARAALPDLARPLEAYPMLAEAVLPPVAKGLFYCGMLATIMSTLNTLAFVSAQTLGRDIVLRLLRPVSPGLTQEERFAGLPIQAMINGGMVVSFALSVWLALVMPSVIQMWYTIGTVVIPGLLVPLMATYFERTAIRPRYAFASMLFGWGASLLWLLAGTHGGLAAEYPFGIEPMYPGLLVSLAFWGLGKFAGGWKNLKGGPGEPPLGH